MQDDNANKTPLVIESDRTFLVRRKDNERSFQNDRKQLNIFENQKWGWSQKPEELSTEVCEIRIEEAIASSYFNTKIIKPSSQFSTLFKHIRSRYESGKIIRQILYRRYNVGKKVYSRCQVRSLNVAYSSLEFRQEPRDIYHVFPTPLFNRPANGNF